MLNKTLGSLFLASLTQTDELKKVVFDLKPGLQGEPLFQLVKVMTNEINNCTALRANEVVVVPRSTDCVAMAATPSV